MAIKKETDAKSKIKVAVKEIAEKAADKVKKVTKVAEKKTAAKSATLKTMKEAEEKAKKETGNSRGQQNTRQGASSRITHCTQYKSFRR